MATGEGTCLEGFWLKSPWSQCIRRRIRRLSEESHRHWLITTPTPHTKRVEQNIVQQGFDTASVPPLFQEGTAKFAIHDNRANNRRHPGVTFSFFLHFVFWKSKILGNLGHYTPSANYNNLRASSIDVCSVSRLKIDRLVTSHVGVSTQIWTRPTSLPSWPDPVIHLGRSSHCLW